MSTADLEKKLAESDKRIQLLEEEVMYQRRDIEILFRMIASINPEIHYHYYNIFKLKQDEHGNNELM